eukprot:550723-Rhodomonas_salina.2
MPWRLDVTMSFVSLMPGCLMSCLAHAASSVPRAPRACPAGAQPDHGHVCRVRIPRSICFPSTPHASHLLLMFSIDTRICTLAP